MGARRSGSFPGSEVANVLSPRSSETGGLGVKMVEYVLGTSPTNKDLESRMRGLVLVSFFLPTCSLLLEWFQTPSRGGPARALIGSFRLCFAQNSTDDKEKKEKASSPSPLQDLEGGTNGGPAHIMLPNGLAEDDKAYKYGSDAASNGIAFHMNVDSYTRTPGSRQPSPSEEDLVKNHSPGVPLAGVPMKPTDPIGLAPSNQHGPMVGSLTGPIQAGGLANGMGPMSGLVNGATGGPPGRRSRCVVVCYCLALTKRLIGQGLDCLAGTDTRATTTR